MALTSYTLQLSSLSNKTSSAPTDTSLSMTVATSLFSTITLTATQFDSSRGLTVGARLPGAMRIHSGSLSLGILYWHNTYLVEAITPSIRFVMRSIRGERWACFGFEDLISTASVGSTVAIA